MEQAVEEMPQYHHPKERDAGTEPPTQDQLETQAQCKTTRNQQKKLVSKGKGED